MKPYLLPFLFMVVCLLPTALVAQLDSTQQASPRGVPVVYHGDTLFLLYGKIGPFSPETRAEGVKRRLDQLVANPASLADTFLVDTSGATVDILSGDLVIMSITPEDAQGAGQAPAVLARQYRQVIHDAIDKKLDLSSPRAILINLGLLLLAILGLLIMFWGVRKLFDLLRGNIKKLEKNIFFSNNRLLQFFKYITPRRERDLLLVVSRTLRYFSYFFVLFFYFPFVFAYLPWTRPYVQQVWANVSKPLVFVWESFTGYLPNLFFIAVILLVTRYLVRFLLYLAKEVEREKIVIDGFYGDWALPTFKLVRVLIYAFALIVMFPYLPGSDSPAFQGVSIFLGLLLSLGSSTAVANVVAGLVITYMRPFQIGDRVKIGDTVGDVMGRSLLVTRLKTIKNEDITIPNANILTGQLKNYSSHAEEIGLILNTTVTIGYDVPWKKVEEALIQAALTADMIEKEPKPFVLKTSLDDFYVSYQLNAYTKQAGKAAAIYSRIHERILDIFNESGIEILSPHYGAHRDGNAMAVPPEDLPDNYEPPAFRLHNPFEIFKPKK
jgi:small-conductance mechanosensitive channel